MIGILNVSLIKSTRKLSLLSSIAINESGGVHLSLLCQESEWKACLEGSVPTRCTLGGQGQGQGQDGGDEKQPWMLK